MSKTNKTEEKLLINSSPTAEDKALFGSTSSDSDADKATEEKGYFESFLLSVSGVGVIKMVEVSFIRFYLMFVLYHVIYRMIYHVV